LNQLDDRRVDIEAQCGKPRFSERDGYGEADIPQSEDAHARISALDLVLKSSLLLQLIASP
jgi:hypothetical protein